LPQLWVVLMLSPNVRWLLVSLLSAIAAVGVVGYALTLTNPYAVLLLAVGVVVFVVVLLHNPANRYWHLMTVLIGSWLSVRSYPSLVVRFDWSRDTFGHLLLSEGVGWSFDLVVVLVGIALIFADYKQNNEKSGLLRAFSLFSLDTSRHQNLEGEAAQQVQLGDITRSNIQLTVNQQKGPQLDEIVKVVESKAGDANAEIDLAVEKLKAGQPDVAIHLLQSLRNRQWESLSSRLQYRLTANLGHAWEAKGNQQEAARHYLKAKECLPEDEAARALEAMACFSLGDDAKAYTLASAILKDHPAATLATAIWVRCAPSDMPFDDIERSVPAATRDHVEVLHALAWRAVRASQLEAAERLARSAFGQQPDSAEIQELVGVVIVQIEAQRADKGQPARIDRVEEAISALTKALEKRSANKDVARLRYTRAEAFMLLARYSDAETDFRSAIECDPGDCQITLRYALLLDQLGRKDDELQLLQKHSDPRHLCRNHGLLATFLGDRNGPGDRTIAIGILEGARPLLEKADIDLRGGLLATLVQLYGEAGEHARAFQVLEDSRDSLLSKSDHAVLMTNALRRAGKRDEALATASQAKLALGESAPEVAYVKLAEAVTSLGEHALAVELWKKGIQPTSASVFVYKALRCASECGDDKFILTFCEQLRKNGVKDSVCLEHEVVTLERYRVFDSAIAIMRDYLAEPGDEELARVFRVRLSLLGLRLDKKELIESDATKLPSVQSVELNLGGAVATILRHGSQPEVGIKYAYELLRRYFSDMTAHGIYVGILGLGDKDSPKISDPSKVAPGCAFKYRADDSGDEHWVIIENSASPNVERQEIGENDPLALETIGKSVGDVFQLRHDMLQPRTAKIIAIVSKYNYRWLDIMERGEERFGTRFFAKRYTSPTLADGSPDPGLLFRALDIREAEAMQANETYRQHPVSLTTFAAMTKTGILESLSHLASEGDLPVRCCRGTAEESQMAMASIEAAGPIVVDPSALATLYFSGRIGDIANAGIDWIVCQGALEEYRETIRELNGKSSTFTGKRRGRYFLIENDPEANRRRIEQLTEFLDKVQNLTSIQSGEALASLEIQKRRTFIDLFGEATAECIAYAVLKKMPLWTDDMATAEVSSSEMGVKRVWTQLVYHHLLAKEKISRESYNDLTFFLLQWRYQFTRLSPSTILAAGKRTHWQPTQEPFACVLRWFAQPEIDVNGIIVLSTALLRMVNENAQLAHQQENTVVDPKNWTTD
jgi:tetratricopeptide (TPR) repeat protein